MGNDRQGVATGLTRSEAAKLLGVHVSSVRRYEARGWLRPTGGRGEERTFDEAEVKALARARGVRAVCTASRDTGASDAAAFRLFGAGHTPEAVVVKLELPAERVRRLFDLWRAEGNPAQAQREDEHSETHPDEERAFRAWEHVMAEAFAAVTIRPPRTRATHARGDGFRPRSRSGSPE